MHKFRKVLQRRRFAQPVLVPVQLDPAGEFRTVGRHGSLKGFPVHEERRVLPQLLECFFYRDAENKIETYIQNVKINYIYKLNLNENTKLLNNNNNA